MRSSDVLLALTGQETAGTTSNFHSSNNYHVVGGDMRNLQEQITMLERECQLRKEYSLPSRLPLMEVQCTNIHSFRVRAYVHESGGR